MLKLLGVSASPVVLGSLGLALIGLGVARGGLLPILVGVLLLAWATVRALPTRHG